MSIIDSKNSTTIGRDRLPCDFKSSRQPFEELIQSNRFTYTKWIPLYRKAYKYSQLLQPCKAGQVLKLRKNVTSISRIFIELRIPLSLGMVILRGFDLISDLEMRRSVLKLYCTSLLYS